MHVLCGITLLLAVSNSVIGQSCRFGMHMGEKYDKCSAICQGRGYKCIGEDTCLCQECPNSMDHSYVHTFDDAQCEFSQECTRKCMDANTDPDLGGNIGKGKKCEFVDDFYGTQSTVCVCGCL